MIEGKVAPLVLFVGFLHWTGMTGALVAALGWSLSAVTYRLATGRTIPGLLLLSVAGLTARTVVALATGSFVVYFLQPTASTALVGLAFVVSLFRGRPLAERLAHDFCPFDAETAEHPMLELFFYRLSLLWAFTSLLNAALTTWLLLSQPVTTFVILKSFLGPTFTAVTVGAALAWLWVAMKRAGVGLQFGSSLAVKAN